MPATKRTPRQIEQDHAIEAELHLKGWTHQAIAERLNITAGQVRYDLRKIQDGWRASAIYDFDLIKQRELRRIDMLEAEAWAAWEKSKTNREITTTRQQRQAQELSGQKQGAGQQPIPISPVSTTSTATKRAEQRDPDARYLAVIQWCISERAKLIGLYAPTELRHSGTVRAVSEFVYELSPEGPVDGLTVIGADPSGHPRLAAPAEPEIEMSDDFGDDLDELIQNGVASG